MIVAALGNWSSPKSCQDPVFWHGSCFRLATLSCARVTVGVGAPENSGCARLQDSIVLTVRVTVRMDDDQLEVVAEELPSLFGDQRKRLHPSSELASLVSAAPLRTDCFVFLRLRQLVQLSRKPCRTHRAHGLSSSQRNLLFRQLIQDILLRLRFVSLDSDSSHPSTAACMLALCVLACRDRCSESTE